MEVIVQPLTTSKKGIPSGVEMPFLFAMANALQEFQQALFDLFGTS